MLDGSFPPPPLDPRDLERVTHTRTRRQVLYSQHRDLILGRIRAQLGDVRAAVIGEPDLSANALLSISTQVSVTYNDTPEILADAATLPMLDLVADSGLWTLMQRTARDTFALRNMLMAAEIDEAGEIAYRPVFPDLVTAKADRRRPNVAAEISEARRDPALGWCWYTHSILDPARPFYTVADADGKDVTEAALGGRFSGDAYPCRDTSSDTPFLPYVFYNAASTGYLFDPYTYREVVEGTLNIGVLLSYYQHLVRNAAWAQRWSLGASPKGFEAEDNGDPSAAREEMVSDPATVAQFRVDEDATNAQIGQWVSPVDPEGVLRSISAYERRVLLLAGLQPPDVTRQEADVRSGYSLAVARESIREAQRVFEPGFRRSDQQLMRITACLLNRANGTAYNENAADYRISYTGLPETPIEAKQRLDELKAKQDAGQVGPVSAFLEMNPAATRDEAVAKLALARTEPGEIESAVRTLLDARTAADGKDPMPQITPVLPAMVQSAHTVIVAASTGQMAPETAYQVLVNVIGLTPAAARAIADSIVPVPAKPAIDPNALPAAA